MEHRGFSYLSNDKDENKQVKLAFPETTLREFVQQLDRNEQYNVFLSAAGQTDINVFVTQDTAEAISKGEAVWSAVQALPACNGVGKFLGTLPKATAIKINAARTAGQSDTAGTVTALGARCVVRLVPAISVTASNVMTDCVYAPLVAF